jgi:hypothetical protein
MQRILLLITALALMLAACGGSDAEGVATLDSTTTTVDASDTNGGSVAEQDEQRLLAFAACMRDNGIEDFPDPRLNADGSVDFGADERPFADVEEEVAEAAFEACADELAGVSFAPGGENFDLTAIEDAFVEFAACMRDRGIDIPDPDFSSFLLGGGDGGISPFGDVDFEDPNVLAAVEECRDVFTGLGFGG